MSTINDFLSLLGTVSSVVNNATTVNPTSVPVAANANAPKTIIQVNLQILPEGFGSYLDGILPSDVAVAAGAFSATMQQVKNVRKIDIEKFAQVVTSLETTEGLPLVNGTNVPTATSEAQAALNLIALGSGPYGTYTFSDLFGCMSGLPYNWPPLQAAISNMPIDNLATLYSNLYAATQGPTLGLDAAVQAQIDLVNAKIAVILTTHPGQSIELNDLYNATATQLNAEQLARDTGIGPVPTPRTPGKNGDLFPYPLMVYSFTDLLPNYALLTAPNLSAQNLEAISDLTLIAGQSIVAAMRAERNQARLIEVGIEPDDNIPDVLPVTDVSVAYPFNVVPTPIVTVPNSSVAAVLGIGTTDGLPIPSGDIGIGTPGISAVSIPTGMTLFFETTSGGVPLVPETLTSPVINPVTGVIFNPSSNPTSQGGGPIVPGSLAGSPYTNLIPPALNPIYTSNVLLPASISVAAAIEQVITCNCDCWIQ